MGVLAGVGDVGGRPRASHDHGRIDRGTGIVDFALGDSGQGIVKETGFVELSIVLESVNVPKDCPDCPDKYREISADYERSSLNFYFQSNSSDLDALANHDIKRALEFLNFEQNKGHSVYLLGFADHHGSVEYDDSISLTRAEAVRRTLLKGMPSEGLPGIPPGRLALAAVIVGTPALFMLALWLDAQEAC